MKVDDQVRQFRSDVTGERVRMGIAEGAEAHLMEVLSKMYNSPPRASMREYSTNALDSHRMAGYDGPIEVTLPTPYLPVLKIRDYGVGMDVDDIRALYSQYGASTKRDSNEQNGMLGIGCKSALAYTDQFTVVGFKHGVKTTVLVSRDEDGAGTMHVVSVDTGQYKDGVEVQIPTKPDDDFDEIAHDFFRFWDEGTVVLIQGDKRVTPRRIGSTNEADGEGGEYKNIWLDDRTLLTNEVDESLVVMGYVAYPLVDGEPEIFSAGRTSRVYNYAKQMYVYEGGYHAVCFVDIGDVNFAPSRESLTQTKRTKDKLDELRKHVKATFDQSIRDQIANAPTAKAAQEALQAGIAMGFDHSGQPAQWQGKDVLLRLVRGRLDPTTGHKSFNDEWDVDACLEYSYLFKDATSYTRKQGERGASLDLDSPQPIFTGFDGKWLTNVKHDKLNLWAANKGVTIGRAVFVDKLTKAEKFWTNGWDVYDWQEVNDTELPKATSADGTTVRLKGSYDAVVNDSVEYGVPAGKIDTTKPLYYCHGNVWTVKGNMAVRSGAVSLDGATLVALSQNRIEKFKRDFPMAVELRDAAKAAAEAWVNTVDRDAVKAHAVKEHRAVNTLQALKGEDFDDAALNTLIRLASTDSSAYEAGLAKFERYVSAPETSAVGKLIAQTIAKYPLADWHSYGNVGKATKEHTVLYIKAVTAARKES